MSSKLSLIISMLFFALFFLLCLDIMTIQFYYSDLDSKSIAISYDISRKGDIDDEYISSLEEKYKLQISDVSPKHPEFGDTVEYIVIREYKPIIVSLNPISIKVKRTTMIGYY